MRIGFDARRYFLNRTGLGDYSRNLIQHLHLADPSIEMHLYASSAGEHYPAPDFAKLHLKGKSPSFYWRNFGIPNTLQRDRIQLYHGLSNELPLGIGRAEIPALVTIHDLLFIRYPGHYAHFDRNIYLFKTKRACKLAHHIITISETTKKDLMHFLEMPEEKISVVPPIATFTPKKQSISGVIPRNADKSTPYILCVSSFQTRKNLERLIDAYHEAKTDYRLIIAGRKGETSRNCAVLVSEKKSGRKAELKFDVGHQEMEMLFNEASAFIYPSIYEGFGMPVLDALHHQLPILTGAGTSMQEIAGDAGIYFDPLQKESITAAIEQFSAPTFDAQHYKNLTNERLTLFSHEVISKKLINIYRKIGN